MSNSNLDVISLVESKFGEKIEVQRNMLGAATITANNGLHYDVMKALLEADEKTGVTSITGLDLGENLGVYYHIHTSKLFITIKAEVPKGNPTIKTLIDIHPGAAFHEKEVADLVGVIFEGHATPGHFVLPETWPEGIFPLRKDVKATEVKPVPTPEREANVCLRTSGSSKSSLVRSILRFWNLKSSPLQWKGKR